MSQKKRPQGQTSDVREKIFRDDVETHIFKKKCEQNTNLLTAKVKVAEYMKKNKTTPINLGGVGKIERQVLLIISLKYFSTDFIPQ